MKRIIATILVLLITVLLVSCNSTADAPTNQQNATQNEVVTLTLDNYQKYISTHIYSCSLGINTYHCFDFVGSSLCKFNDVTITYSYNDEDYSRICVLNLSGCGQTTPLVYFSQVKLNIIDISGTVEILY